MCKREAGGCERREEGERRESMEGGRRRAERKEGEARKIIVWEDGKTKEEQIMLGKMRKVRAKKKMRTERRR